MRCATESFLLMARAPFRVQSDAAAHSSGFELTTWYNSIYEAILQVKFCTLKVLAGSFSLMVPSITRRPAKPMSAPGSAKDDIPLHGKAGGDAAGSRVGEHRYV